MNLYANAQQNFQARSPVFIHATSTAAGLVTIRASKNQEVLVREFETHYDDHTKAYFAVVCVNRWFGIRLGNIVVFYTVFIVYACIAAKGNFWPVTHRKELPI
jgi:hypothetical protein